MISQNLAFGLMLNFTLGYFENFEIEDESGVISKGRTPQGQGEGLARVEISAGLRFIK
jgi:hypothetical protein